MDILLSAIVSAFVSFGFTYYQTKRLTFMEKLEEGKLFFIYLETALKNNEKFLTKFGRINVFSDFKNAGNPELLTVGLLQEFDPREVILQCILLKDSGQEEKTKSLYSDLDVWCKMYNDSINSLINAKDEYNDIKVDESMLSAFLDSVKDIMSSSRNDSKKAVFVSKYNHAIGDLFRSQTNLTDIIQKLQNIPARKFIFSKKDLPSYIKNLRLK